MRKVPNVYCTQLLDLPWPHGRLWLVNGHRKVTMGGDFNMTVLFGELNWSWTTMPFIFTFIFITLLLILHSFKPLSWRLSSPPLNGEKRDSWETIAPFGWEILQEKYRSVWQLHATVFAPWSQYPISIYLNNNCFIIKYSRCFLLECPWLCVWNIIHRIFSRLFSNGNCKD